MTDIIYEPDSGKILLLLLHVSSAQEFNYWTQQINLKDPKDYPGLFRPIQNNTENNYLQINQVFGFTYFFPKDLRNIIPNISNK